MTRTALRLTLILTVVFAAAMLLLRAAYGATTTVSPPTERFSSPSCDGPCWLGIEPGITQEADAVTIMEALAMDYQYRRNQSLAFAYRTEDFTYNGDFWSLNPGGDGTVQAINLRQQPCPVSVMMAYGIPDRTFLHGGGLLLYFDEGVAVGISEVEEAPGTFDINMTLLTREDMMSYIDNATAQSLVRLSWRESQEILRRAC